MARWLSWLERRPVTAEVVGSNPIRVVVIISQMITCWKQLTIIYGVLAQLGEHLPYKQRVTGSSPVGPTCTIKQYNAGVAELADAQDLKSCCGNTVPVRFRSPALRKHLQKRCLCACSSVG